MARKKTGSAMSLHTSKVTVHLVIKDVPVHTESHPEDITVAAWKQILADQTEAYIKSGEADIEKALRDYTITDPSTVRKTDLPCLPKISNAWVSLGLHSSF